MIHEEKKDSKNRYVKFPKNNSLMLIFYTKYYVYIFIFLKHVIYIFTQLSLSFAFGWKKIYLPVMQDNCMNTLVDIVTLFYNCF